MGKAIAAYRAKLHAALEACMEEPVNCRSVGNCTMLMDALCALDRMESQPAGKTADFAADDAQAWVSRMENEDGSVGEHWTMDQTSAAARSIGADLSAVGTAAWYAAMNMVYSDYYSVAHEYGLDRPDFYAKLAQAFLVDKDAGGPQRKIAAYYRCIAQKV